MSKWTDHVNRWKGCTRCPLHQCRGRAGKVVLARGALPCQILFVGEAPGPSENIVGVPFIGPAGHLLDEIIADAGYNLADHDFLPVRYAFTNLVSCIPLDDEKKKFAEPPKLAIEACAPRLKELIAMAQPELIVCVGALADKWVPKLGISVKTVAITHPSAILQAQLGQRGLMKQRATVILRDALEELLEVGVNRAETEPSSPKTGRPGGA